MQSAKSAADSSEIVTFLRELRASRFLKVLQYTVKNDVILT